MPQAATPPAPAPTATEIVVARDDHTTVAASLDLPLTIVKAGRREEMVVRRAVFLTAAVVQARPAGGAADVYRWKLSSFLERQYCVRSLTGQFACTTPEVASLPDAASGEAPAAAPGQFPLAAAAEKDLAAALAARSDAIFAADRQATVEPLLKAAGVKLAPTGAPKAPGRR